MIAFSPPSSSTRRLLDGMAACAASSPGANLKVGDLHAALMDSAVIGYIRAPKRGAWRVHPSSLPPCQRRRKRICQRKILAVILNFTNLSSPYHPEIPNFLYKPIYFFPSQIFDGFDSALMKQDNWATKNLKKTKTVLQKHSLKNRKRKLSLGYHQSPRKKRWWLVHLSVILCTKTLNNAHENVNVDMSLAQGQILQKYDFPCTLWAV